MTNWRSRIAAFRKVSLLPKFLDARIHNEQEARYLLDTKAGNFDKTDLIDFLTKCNKEMVPPNIHTNILNDHETCTRFQLSFIGQNRNLMVATLIECNNWMHKLWRSPDDGIYESLELFWRNGRIKGAGSGLPTMIMYLKYPDKYNVWIPFLSDALGIITGRTFEKQKNVENYKEYNKCINGAMQRLISDPPLKPQEIDYILYRIGRI